MDLIDLVRWRRNGVGAAVERESSVEPTPTHALQSGDNTCVYVHT